MYQQGCTECKLTAGVKFTALSCEGFKIADVLSSPFLHVTGLRRGTKQNELATGLNHSINLPYKLLVLKREQSTAGIASVCIRLWVRL